MLHGRRLARFVAALLFAAALGAPTSATQLGLPAAWLPKLDPLLRRSASLLTGRTRVVVRAGSLAALPLVRTLLVQTGAIVGRSLPIVAGVAADVPNLSLPLLAANPLVAHISADRIVVGAMERTSATVGATAAREEFGYDGSGIGVAIIDSGVTGWHDDLGDGTAGAQRVDRFVDLVGTRQAPYDDFGHGSHVAGIVAGNGFDSGGRRAGIAPGAHLIALKVLDGAGRGRISDVIAALDYVVSHRTELNIRVANLSVATGVYESYNTDPLTLAARGAVDAGIVVVAAAGNNGRAADGVIHYGGITAPGNAPWVLTVGASSHMGTIDRGDDTIAAFSSRGPTAIDRLVKPDLAAPGVGIESLSDPESAFYTSKAPYLLAGTAAMSYRPYLSLSGTSMAAPVVAGAVALMLQASPSLTPAQVKAILRHTAESSPQYDRLTQGAGFLNARSAVALARQSTGTIELIDPWLLDMLLTGRDTGGTISNTSDDDAGVVWGTDDDSGVVWGTTCGDPSCEPIVWGQP